jgi:hypothetical protein
VEQAGRAKRNPAIFVIDPERLADAKDPDALVRERGVDAWNDLVATRACGITWRALAFTRGVGLSSAPQERREVLACAGAWLGSLPSRLALEQEDAVRAVALRCGYSEAAVERAFRARYWSRHAAGR